MSSQLRETWVYAIDAALTFSPSDWRIATRSTPRRLRPWLPAAAGLLAVFAQERHRRLEGLLELNNAYRGTALVLGDVVEADDGYTGEHSRGVVALALSRRTV